MTPLGLRYDTFISVSISMSSMRIKVTQCRILESEAKQPETTEFSFF